MVGLTSVVLLLLAQTAAVTCDPDECGARAAAIRHEAFLAGEGWGRIHTGVPCAYLEPWPGIDVLMTQKEHYCLVSRKGATATGQVRTLHIHAALVEWQGRNRAEVLLTAEVEVRHVQVRPIIYSIIRHRGRWFVESRRVDDGPIL